MTLQGGAGSKGGRVRLTERMGVAVPVGIFFLKKRKSKAEAQ
jgi:hypothetical protein